MKREEMEKRFGIELPIIPEISGPLDVVEEKISELTDELKDVYLKVIELLTEDCSLKKDDYQRVISQLNPYKKRETVSDSKAFNVLNQKFFELNAVYLELMLKQQECESDVYELDYMMRSEIHKLFHESPEDRKERLEDPITEEMEEVDLEVKEVEKEIEKLNLYSIKDTNQNIWKDLEAFSNEIELEISKING